MRTVAPLIGSGSLVLVDGVQHVVARARDGELIKAVRTGGDRVPLLVAPDEVQLVVRPDRLGCCLVCGDVWVWHGDRTSHCPVCHETFEGGTLWDAHRVETQVSGRFACRNAASMVWRGARLRKVADTVPGVVLSGTWRGVGPDRSVFA